MLCIDLSCMVRIDCLKILLENRSLLFLKGILNIMSIWIRNIGLHKKLLFLFLCLLLFILSCICLSEIIIHRFLLLAFLLANSLMISFIITFILDLNLILTSLKSWKPIIWSIIGEIAKKDLELLTYIGIILWELYTNEHLYH